MLLCAFPEQRQDKGKLRRKLGRIQQRKELLPVPEGQTQKSLGVSPEGRLGHLDWAVAGGEQVESSEGVELAGAFLPKLGQEFAVPERGIFGEISIGVPCFGLQSQKPGQGLGVVGGAGPLNPLPYPLGLRGGDLVHRMPPIEGKLQLSGLRPKLIVYS